jgi:hypothetical protein
MRYEYKFIRHNYSGGRPAEPEHHALIQEYASEGWRLVQIFAPGDTFGTPKVPRVDF